MLKSLSSNLLKCYFPFENRSLSSKAYSNYKKSRTKFSLPKKGLQSVKENTKLTVIDLQGKCGIGRITENSRLISSVLLGNKCPANFGDTVITKHKNGQLLL